MTTNSDVKYRHIISLGHFCSVASEIERFGFRDKSYPLDWVLSKSFESVVKLINNRFGDYLKEDYLYQSPSIRWQYRNMEYNIEFVHDFSEWKSFDSQIEEVRQKYQRRINGFYKAIQEPTLFIRYVCNEKELRFIQDNYHSIVEMLRSYNTNNSIVFIANRELQGINDDGFAFKIYFVAPDENDTVSRKFLDSVGDLVEYIDQHYYSGEVKNSNLEFYQNKQRKKKRAKLTQKMKTFFHKLFSKRYIHSKIYQ